MAQTLGDAPASGLGVAVSGGGDSLALMLLLADWARPRGVALRVATVDHGLRPDAAAEARDVACRAEAAGLAHDTLVWRDWDGRGNLQAAARAARLTLLSDWAAMHGLTHVCLGHTRNDQAETVLLRLARGSGVDGLAGMAARRTGPGGVVLLRPLLSVGRAALRDWLAARGEHWAEDPANDDTRFDRVKARALLAAAPLPGLDSATLAETATRMAAAREVLGRAAQQAAKSLAEADHADLVFAVEAFFALPDDTRWRLLAAALAHVSGAPYRPRLSALRRAEQLARAGRGATLQGAMILPERGRLRIAREPAAAARHTATWPARSDRSTAAPDAGSFAAEWDGRWRVEGPANVGDVPVELRVLGEDGAARLPAAARGTVSRPVLLASPAIWRAGDLLCAPLADSGAAWRARPLRGKSEFTASLISD